MRISPALTRFPFTQAIQAALLSFVAAILPESLCAQGASGDAVDEDVVEEIMDSRTRATIQSVIDIRRNSKTIVDGLSATDIGDLPALSTGEALETVTGVASHLENRGATEISMRGLGPYSDLHRKGQGRPGINLDRNSLAASHFVRPKWGIYRSMLDWDNLRPDEETVRFANFSVSEVMPAN